MDGCGGDEQHPRAHHEPRQRAVTIGVRVAEAMGLVDEKQAAAGGSGRQWAGRSCAEGFVGNHRGVGVEPREQRAPLVHQYRRHHQGERLAHGERDRQGDIRLAEARCVRQQRAAVARQQGAQPLGGGDLVWGEPRGPRRPPFRAERRQVEQRPRPERRDRRRRVDRPRCEEAGERLGERTEVLRKDPGRLPAHGDRRHRAGTGPRWRHHRIRRAAPGRPGRATPLDSWAEAAARAPRGR